MTPAARVSAAIEILDAVLDGARGNGADALGTGQSLCGIKRSRGNP